MTDLPLREPEQIRQDCAAKLRRVQTSGVALAILGCLLGEDWASPRIVEMQITPDRSIMARLAGAVACSEVVGTETDLINNLQGIAKVAGLDSNELAYLMDAAANLKRMA
jgi:hypothetical protein